MIWVLLTVVNPNKENKLPPTKQFLLGISEDDDEVFSRLKSINGKGFYYKVQSAMFGGTDFGKDTKFYGEPNDSARHNLLWFAALIGGYDAKWSQIRETLKNNIGLKQFAEVTAATSISVMNDAVYPLTVITELLH